MEAIRLTNGLNRIGKLELLNALGDLKQDAKDSDKVIIDSLINSAKLHLISHTQLNLLNKEDCVRKISLEIKTLALTTNKFYCKYSFTFVIRAISTEIFLYDMNNLNLRSKIKFESIR